VKLTRKIRVKNSLGLHTRPATAIVKLLQNSKSSVKLTYKRDTINAKSILSILMLAVQKNANITLTIEGEDAETTMDQLANAFDSCFGEGS